VERTPGLAVEGRDDEAETGLEGAAPGKDRVFRALEVIPRRVERGVSARRTRREAFPSPSSSC
jgi:hypothetical protein